jgi:4-amino-4-deoxy-L-arabinose transferase-like glycosyltransferase
MSSASETRPLASSTASAAPVATPVGARWRLGMGTRRSALRVPRPELVALIVLAAALNLWSLSRNGWANDYYSAAARSMSSSWHDFLFASLDHSGVMTVDKPPLALWVQALSVRVLGFRSLSMLVPQALMGVAAVALLYDLVRRSFGRIGGFVAGLALALTPITVAVSRHNNPDALLVLLSVAALWCTVRALGPETRRRSRWLVLAGVCVGLGFETKMGEALTVVPGIAAAWLWVAPSARGRLHALRELLAGGAAMVLVGGAWPALVELTPAGDRPWVSGTTDNRVLSLIFEYNGVGRVSGQAGGAGAASTFGSSPGPLRLLNQALGGQAGWLLGFAAVSGLALLAASRLRRTDARSGWLIVVGGAFLTTAVLFSAASGIFHPYYVSLLAPFIAALVGAGAAQLIDGRLSARIVGPTAIAAGVACEIVVRNQYPGQFPWLAPVLIVLGAVTGLALIASGARPVRVAAVSAMLAAMLIAPSVWALDTLGYAASSTFPAGGPASAQDTGFGGRRAPGGAVRSRRFGNGGQIPPAQLFGTVAGGSRVSARRAAGSLVPPAGGPPAGGGGAQGFTGGAGPAAPARAFPGQHGGGFTGPFGGALGGDSALTAALAYAKAHGGGTVAVPSQSSAAAAIIAQDGAVAGIGGFSGRESSVSVSWLSQAVRAEEIRWVQAPQGGAGFSARLPGDTRMGSSVAIAAVTKACRRVTLPADASAGAGAARDQAAPLYDCRGRATRLLSVGTRGSRS